MEEKWDEFWDAHGSGFYSTLMASGAVDGLEPQACEEAATAAPATQTMDREGDGTGEVGGGGDDCCCDEECIELLCCCCCCC
mmetsp:Transcript_31873/g.40973  ORF Transcript_31873/g.40973 Transcript_31873/m.40973 type:complete len:82 (-) Transcript_31873:307-552(-)